VSLTDLMSAAQLDHYAQVGLIAFMFAFALILWRTFSPRNRSMYQRAGQLPLEDEMSSPPRTPSSTPEA
jgi:cbb3-type cytochrome oxidase subunit 3